MDEQVYRLDEMSVNFLTAFDNSPLIFPDDDPGKVLLRDTFGTAAECLQSQMVESQTAVQDIHLPLPPFQSFLPQPPQTFQSCPPSSLMIRPLNEESDVKGKRKNEEQVSEIPVKKKRNYKPRQPKANGETATKKKSYKTRQPKKLQATSLSEASVDKVEVIEEGKAEKVDYHHHSNLSRILWRVSHLTTTLLYQRYHFLLRISFFFSLLDSY